MILLDGKKIADELQSSLKEEAALLLKKGIQPGLGIVLIGDNPASVMYVSLKEKMAEELGFYFRKEELSSTCAREDFARVIESLNHDPRINGILVQIPLPSQFSIEDVGALLDPRKDVDCFHSKNLEALFAGNTLIAPPTAESVTRLIESSGRALQGASLIMVGSGFFGRQIAAHCKNKGAAVTLANSKTENLSSAIKTADVVVVAIGKPRFITGEMVKPGAVVIDVGINRVGQEVVGDVDFDSVQLIASALTPVPGGVGPLTVALLMENVVKAARQERIGTID